jgi:hypothetical protein
MIIKVCSSVRRRGASSTLACVDDYWRSPQALERKRIYRWLETVRAALDDEPRQKGRAGKRQARPFRAAVREALVHRPQWPRPRAALAVDFHFHATDRQPPALWRLPKNYLDLLGETSASAGDLGPLLYRDDAQVKLLYASLTTARTPDSRGSIYLKARTRASAVNDLELAAELLDHEDDLEDNTSWAEADPWDDLEHEDESQYLPADLAEWLQVHDKFRYQAMLFGSNDRLLRSVFFRNARWLLTGANADVERLHWLGLAGHPVAEEVINRIAETNAHDQKLLWSTIGIELPPLPLQRGDGAQFDEGVRQAFRNFVEERPDLQPLLVPLRVTVLVVPPLRPKRKSRKGRNSDVKDLDNILIKVLTALEEQLKPNAEPWLLLPDVSVEGSEPDPDLAERKARYRSYTGSHTWAYQVLELHREPGDPDQGSLVVVPGLGWNRKSIWAEAEDFVERRLQKLMDE